MSVDIATRSALRLLGVGVLAIFIMGAASGPIRTCLSHPGHASGELAMAPEFPSAHGPEASASHGPTSEHEGCSCLERCSLEQAPGLLESPGPGVADDPSVPKTLAAPWVRPYAPAAAFDIPLARPPPAVV